KEIVESTSKVILVTEQKGNIVSVNPAFTSLTGYAEEDVLGKNPNTLSSGKQDKQFYEKMWDTISTYGEWQGSIWNKRKNGEQYLQLLMITAVKDETDEVIRYVGTFSDITDL